MYHSAKLSFNTASGRYYCNLLSLLLQLQLLVSIPQAVGTIAIEARQSGKDKRFWGVSIPQAVGTIAIKRTPEVFCKAAVSFQYRKR